MARTDELPLALLGFVALVVMAPIWFRYAGGLSLPRPEGRFIALLVFPSVAALFVTSWVKPEFAGLLLGGLMVVCMVLLYPWFFRLIDMANSLLGGSPLSRTIMQLTVPVLVLSFIASLGRRRIREGQS